MRDETVETGICGGQNVRSDGEAFHVGVRAEEEEVMKEIDTTDDSGTRYWPRSDQCEEMTTVKNKKRSLEVEVQKSRRR